LGAFDDPFGKDLAEAVMAVKGSRVGESRDQELDYEDVLRKTLVLDGVTYVITAQRIDGGWHGAWTCTDCEASGYHGVLEATVVHALDAAEHNLKNHHRKAHKKPARPR
jgi:hypothetical protein